MNLNAPNVIWFAEIIQNVMVDLTVPTVEPIFMESIVTTVIRTSIWPAMQLIDFVLIVHFLPVKFAMELLNVLNVLKE